MVSIWDQIDREIEYLREQAEAGMRDRVRIWRDVDTEPVADSWGTVTALEPTLVYEGRAKAQNDRTYPASPDVGDAARVLTIVSSVHLPYGTTSVRSGDVCEWVESKNPRLVGQKVRLRVDEDKTWQTAVRFNVVEVVE